MKLISLILCFLCVACSTQKHTHNSPQVSDNAKFLKDDLDVKLWQERFENRDRDVYKNKDQIVQNLQLKAGDRVVDVGAGTGFFLKPLHDQVGEKGLVYAVEISPAFVKFLRARGDKEGITNLKVIKGGLDQTNLPIGSVDKVFVCDTYHHFDKPQNMLDDFRKILKPGGELIIVDFDREKGKSREWIAKHIKLSKEDYINQIQGYGFELKRESGDFLTENFMLHFKVK